MDMVKAIARVAAVAAVFAVFTSGAAAQDVKVDGNWVSTFERNGQKIETTFKLKLEGEKLTGSVSGRGGTDTAIEEASFKDGEVKFSVSRERNGQKTTTVYTGKISGDKITGTAVTGDRSREWTAERKS
ncbi:MAG TPA: hypothetical protein VIE39_02060 [Thermoanaerobaculia bacterium]|jgi:hypothetical protein